METLPPQWFAGKTLALGVGASVAAYKACDLLRSLQRQGMATIYPVLSGEAHRFVSPLTLTALAKQTARDDVWAVTEDGVPWHIAYAQRCDALLIVGASANLLARLAAGMADDLLSTTCLTFTNKPVLIAPAMNTRMWEHPMVQANVAKLQALPNVTFVNPGCGLLACGETGDGHLASEALLQLALAKALHPQNTLYKGVKALLTVGGTQQPLDAVRVFTNRSSGKMGMALADELYAMGAEVTVVSALSVLPERPYTQVQALTVQAMREAVLALAPTQQLILKVAAVADWLPETVASLKLKKHELLNEAANEAGRATLRLKPAPDILAELGANKPEGQVLVGFAAETHNGLAYAKQKLEAKHLDALALNDVSQANSGMGADNNAITLLLKGQTAPAELPLQAKHTLATALLQALNKQFFESVVRTC